MLFETIGNCIARSAATQHARGAQREEVGDDQLLGLIPACAGSRSRRSTRDAVAGAHPRVRGEHPPSSHPDQ